LRQTVFGRTLPAFEVLKRIIPVALKTAKPGTPEFREAIRAALLTEHEIPASQGVYNFTGTDRYSTTARGSS
jgi:branched-chain amino acid transport system substrate-binding protein